MSSVVNICNMALAHLGQDSTIGNLETERSKEARVCKSFYETVRDATLREFPWPFAKRTVVLPLVREEVSSGFRFVYKYPTDCLRVVRIPNGLWDESIEQRIPFEIQSDVTGSLIYTNMPMASVEYIKRIEDPAYYTPDFILALSYHLAYAIAPTITGDDPFALGRRAYQSYQQMLAKAKTTAMNERVNSTPLDSEFVRVRG